MPKSVDAPSYSLMERNGHFYVQWWDPTRNKRRLSLGTKNRDEAKRALGRFLAGLESPEPPKSPDLQAILGGYVVDRRECGIASIQSIEHAAAAVSEHLGTLSAEHLTRKACRDYARKRHQQGRRGMPDGKWRAISDGTIIKELVTLRSALRWAHSEKWISTVPYVETPSAPPPRDRWLTKAEFQRLLGNTSTPHVRLFMLLALYTGARTSAILELTWDQVDLALGIIRFGAGVGNKGRSTVPIVPELLSALKDAAFMRTTDWVIEYRGDRIRKIKTAFNKRAKAAGLTGVTPHTLRHTCATWMVMGGVPFEMVAKYLGNSIEMVERVYGHHSPQWLKRAADALSLFSGPRGPE
ncbi:tyrosine-type recombinase/integrase [Gluconacetobacter sp. Hr-1-5]|uniref:tyrosine-type recombinase/integrase n=1 Tax=Gluconacetobacter sp. Hr-1-5 TaxID=3395370 RepID=UPI003B51C3B4